MNDDGALVVFAFGLIAVVAGTWMIHPGLCLATLGAGCVFTAMCHL